jgi:WD40 repeat protein
VLSNPIYRRSAAAFTADLDFLVAIVPTYSEKGEMIRQDRALIWDVNEHRQRAELAPLGGDVLEVAIDPGGRFIATAGDGGLRIWSLKGVELKQWGTFPERARSVTFSPEGKRLAWGSDAGIRILDLDNPGAVSSLTVRTAPGHAGEEVSGLGFVPGHEQLAVAGQLWDLKTLSPIKRVRGSIFSADGELVASDLSDMDPKDAMHLNGAIQIATLAGDQIALLTGHNETGDVQAFGPGRLVLTSWGDKKLRIWDLSPRFDAEFKSLTSTMEMSDTTPRVYATDDSYDESNVDRPVFPSFPTGRGNAIKIWSPEGRVRDEFPTRPGPRGPLQFFGFSLSQDSKMLSVCYDASCTLWDTKTKHSQDIPLQGKMIGIMNVSGKPALISIDGDVVRAQDGSGPARILFSLPSAPISIVLNPARTRLVAAYPSGVSVWDLTGHPVSGFSKQLAASVEVLPGSDVQRVGITEAGNTSVYDQSGKRIAEFEFPAKSLSPDGKLLATTGGPSKAGGGPSVPMLWDVATKKPFAQFLGLGDYEVKFTPDGKFVTVLSSDVLPRLWRVETTEELVTKGCKWIGDYLRNNSDVGKEDRKLCGPQTR